MPTIEQTRRIQLFKKLTEILLFGASFSISATLLASIIFKSLYLFYAFLVCAFSYAFGLVLYYFTFMRRKLPFRIFTFLFMFLSISILTGLMYLAGGFAGAMVSSFFIIIIISALLLEEKRAIYISLSMLIIYGIFLIGETYNIITPLIKDTVVLKYSKAIIDVLSFSFATFLITIIAKNAKDSVKFYRLRSARLSKMRKRLEVLVKRRTISLRRKTNQLKKKTKELRQSNIELRKAQTELRKSYKELKKLDIKKNEFISITSHELQTPMTTILGFSQLLNKPEIFETTRRRRKYLKIIKSESERLSKLVREMLDLSRIDLGTLKFNIITFDVAELLEEIKIQLEQKAKAKKLKIEINKDKNLPKMNSDREKLEQILINLVSNATKYTEKGTITVEAHKQGKNIQFSVADTGMGIPKKEFSKIFERFYQVGYSHGRKTTGAGLGLSICREFVELMGGKIWLTSKVGKGTTFYFTLPIKLKPPEPIKTPKVAKSSTPSKLKNK